MERYLIPHVSNVRYNTCQVRSGCVVGCLRQQQGWSMASIVSEFEQFSEPEGSFSDLQFIESFKPIPVSPKTEDPEENSTVPTV